MPISLKVAQKRDKILHGLRKLCEEQKATQRSYTTVEIAAACDCSSVNIGLIEKKALEAVYFRLLPIARELDVPIPKVRKKIKCS